MPQDPPPGQSEKTLAAHQAFWTGFRAGRYEMIDALLAQLTEAEAEAPSDATTPALRGFLHIWRVAENVRGDGLPSLNEEVVAARDGFTRSLELNPSDARIAGFRAAMIVLQGTLSGDPSVQAEGAEAMQSAVDAWPEFNLFTAGYMHSIDPADSPSFQAALEQQWQNLEVCLGTSIDRQHPDLTGFLAPLGPDPKKLACTDQGLAPHNMSGFLLSMGDMLVKAGRWEVAQGIYGGAKGVEGYATWPYKGVLEDRIRNAQANVARFQQVTFTEPVDTIMFASKFSCMGCHETTSP